jgi:hypothetical protein
MGRGIRATACAVAAAAAALAVAAPAVAANRVIAVDGVAKKHSGMRVEILVEVPVGTSAGAAAARALEAQGAKPAPAPPQSAGFTLTGLKWEVLPVVQNYNPAGQPTAAALTALTNTYGDWSSVSGSIYRITPGGATSRCPSLVKGCRGGQRYDGFNDVGWARLSGSTLGVTWYSTSIDEADMAINTRYAWSTGCTQVGGAYDLETVYLHENGHVAGLGHSSDSAAVMYPSYQTARCVLGQDDKNGLASLY